MSQRRSTHLTIGMILLSLNLFFIFGVNTAEGAKKTGKKPYLVVLDPGHGGQDTGAAGKIGTTVYWEKDIALALAVRTSKVLTEKKYWAPLGRPIKVVLTRDSNKDVSLEDRSQKARDLKADLFVSIHLNSDPSGQARGLETYILNNTDSSSSSKLEEIENKMSKKYAQAKPTSLLIRSIAADAVTDSSRDAAKLVQSSLVDHLRQNNLFLPDRGVRQALLYVLLEAQVPAVLVEAGFVNNKKDLVLVNTGEARQVFAEGIAKGILRYLATI